MAAPRIYSLDVEDRYWEARVAPYVPKDERMTNNYTNRFPLPIDRYRVEIHKPTLNLRSRDAASEQDDLINGFNRLGYEAKQRWAFMPSANYYKANIADKTGHPSGRVGITGELVVEDIDDNLGGAYFADLDHFDMGVTQQVVAPAHLIM